MKRKKNYVNNVNKTDSINNPFINSYAGLLLDNSPEANDEYLADAKILNQKIEREGVRFPAPFIVVEHNHGLHHFQPFLNDSKYSVNTIFGPRTPHSWFLG